jgi:hypothetical protein
VNSCRIFLIESEAKLTGGIEPGGEVIIVRRPFKSSRTTSLTSGSGIKDWVDSMEVVVIEFVVTLLTVALDIGLASLDRAPSLEVCSWRSIVTAIDTSQTYL